MKRERIVLVLLAAAFIGFSVQQTFAQKKGKSKMIVFPTPSRKPLPKELYVEVKITGSGAWDCKSPSLTCTWSINRQYSGKVVFNDFLEVPVMPFDLTKLEQGTATAIAMAKQAKTAAVSNYKWVSVPLSPQDMYFDVKVSINDEVKINFKEKKMERGEMVEETKTVTDTWKTNKTDKGVRHAEVILDKQNRTAKFLIMLNSDVMMTFWKERSWEELPQLPREDPVFPLPTIKDYLHSEVTIPIFGDISDLKNVSFEKSFKGIKSPNPLLGGIAETKEAEIIVTYRFK